METARIQPVISQGEIHAQEEILQAARESFRKRHCGYFHAEKTELLIASLDEFLIQLHQNEIENLNDEEKGRASQIIKSILGVYSDKTLYLYLLNVFKLADITHNKFSERV